MIQTEIVALNLASQATVDQVERKVLEDTLVRGAIYPLLATPVAVDPQGKLEEVVSVVRQSIANFDVMELDTEDAKDEFNRCLTLVDQGKFVRAVGHCAEAMQELIKDNKKGGRDDDDD